MKREPKRFWDNCDGWGKFGGSKAQKGGPDAIIYHGVNCGPPPGWLAATSCGRWWQAFGLVLTWI